MLHLWLVFTQLLYYLHNIHQFLKFLGEEIYRYLWTIVVFQSMCRDNVPICESQIVMKEDLGIWIITCDLVMFLFAISCFANSLPHSKHQRSHHQCNHDHHRWLIIIISEAAIIIVTITIINVTEPVCCSLNGVVGTSINITLSFIFLTIIIISPSLSTSENFWTSFVLLFHSM